MPTPRQGRPSIASVAGVHHFTLDPYGGNPRAVRGMLPSLTCQVTLTERSPELTVGDMGVPASYGLPIDDKQQPI